MGVVGDVASSMGLQVKTQLQQPYVAQLLQEGLASGDDATMDTANWAGGIISQILQSN